MTETNTTTSEELTKLKLTELRKLCKKHELSANGTKLELISRLIENQSENFTILQPGDEAKLLGDDVDEESLPLNLSDQATLENLVDADDDDEDLVNVLTTSDVKPVRSPIASTVTGSKRSSSLLTSSSVCPVPEKSANLETTVSNIINHKAELETSGLHSEACTTMPDAERIKLRAERFGMQRPPGAGAALTDDKLVARARRFGLPVNESRATTGATSFAASNEETKSIDPEVLRKRAERFGEVTNPIVDKLTEEQRKANRIARFGPISTESTQTITASSHCTTSDAERKAARASKFGLVSDEDKLTKRKARFGLV